MILRRAIAPTIAFFAVIVGLELLLRLCAVPQVLAPPPSMVLGALIGDADLLSSAAVATLLEALQALALATIGGLSLAVLFVQYPTLERAFMPFAVILQVTPLIAIAPILLIYLDAPQAILICASVVAFFPILSNATTGLKSVPAGLNDLFQLAHAKPWQYLLYLRFPAALPALLTGLRIGGGLALIGAVAGELAAGAGGHGEGLAFRIVEAGFRLNIARMYAAVALLCLCGVLLYGVLDLFSRAILRRWPQ